MPIIVQQQIPDQTTLVNDILNCASQDVRGVLNPFIGVSQVNDLKILTDYTNTISLDLLRHSRFTFLLSAPQTFSTTPTTQGTQFPAAQNNLYWVGPSGQNPPGTIDTGLNLADFDIMKRDEVVDYTNFKRLAYSSSHPIAQEFSIPAKPRIWVMQPDKPFVLQLWPAPDNAYQITFRYYRARVQLTTATQVIQIPDRYKDIMCHGVTWYAFQYLKSYPEDVQEYMQLYKEGKTQIIKDMNLFPRAEEYVRPDPSSVTRQTTTGIGLDSGLETSIP